VSKLREKQRSRDGVLGGAALIVATAALVWSIVGSAGAASTHVLVQKGDIAPGAVTTKSLAKGAVTAKKIRKHAVTGAKLAEAAVHTKNIASESVNQRVLRKGAVGTTALAPDAVTAAQLAPGSVYGGALGTETLVTKPIQDLDTVIDKNWTPSNIEAAMCGTGEALLGTGFAFTNSGDSEVSWLQALPILNGGTKGVTGRISSNSGGTATAEVAALCLK
jgi:hypothetical protein